MGLFDLFKNKEERRKKKRLDEALKRADDVIERIERMLDEMR